MLEKIQNDLPFKLKLLSLATRCVVISNRLQGQHESREVTCWEWTDLTGMGGKPGLVHHAMPAG